MRGEEEMKNDEAETSIANDAKLLLGLTMTLALFTQGAYAQQPAESKSGADSYQTVYLSNLTRSNDANDIQTDLRNMLPQAKLYYVPSQGALSIRGSAEDISLAQKIVSDLDRNKKIYRLTYTITDIDNGKRLAPQHFSIIVASGSKTDFKQGSKVPLVTGSYTENGPGSSNSQVQYQDIGLEIEASLNAYLDGVRVGTKIGESSVADEKSGVGAQDPIFRQTTLEGTATLAPGKPLVLGSLDIPGSTRRQEVEVVAEAVR
jgi:type II secretory pathway component GspD/PulD (secretin)